MPHIAKRLQRMQESPLRKFLPLAKEGDVRFNIGQPDIPTPKEFFLPLKDLGEVIAYGRSQGQPETIEAMVWYYQHLGFSDINPENIIVTVGGSEALLWAMFGTCEYGDEIVVFEPFYTNYNAFAQFTGVRLAAVTTKIESGFHLPPQDEIETKIKKGKTKGILLTNPNNPTGTVYTREELQIIAKLAKKYDLWILSDETYREFVYDGSEMATSMLSFRGLEEHVVDLNSLSKRYSFCGGRVGMAVSRNTDLIKEFLKLGMMRLSGPTIEEKMAAQLREVKNKYLKEVREEYRQRREIVCQGLDEIPGVVYAKPEGAFYVMASLPVSDSEEFTEFLLREEFRRIRPKSVVVSPGPGFYASEEGREKGKNEIRIAYVFNQKELREGMERLGVGVGAFQARSK